MAQDTFPFEHQLDSIIQNSKRNYSQDDLYMAFELVIKALFHRHAINMNEDELNQLVQAIEDYLDSPQDEPPLFLPFSLN